MAPKKRASKGPPPSEKTIGSRVQKSKPNYKPVRRFENGMLDVERKSGKYTKITKQNARAPLLCLPPEIRNQIWQMALSGKAFSVWLERGRLYSIDRHQLPRQLRQEPDHDFALLQTCRQIYAEAVCYPYQGNNFNVFVRRHPPNTVTRDLPQYGKDNIRQIQLETCMSPSRLGIPVRCSRLPRASFVGSLTSLRRVVIKVCRHEAKMGLDRWKQLTDKAQQNLLDKYTMKRKDVEVVFVRGMMSWI